MNTPVEAEQPSPTVLPEALCILPEDQVYAALATRAAGLSQSSVQARLEEVGPNILQKAEQTSLLLEFLANFTHLMALLLWAAGLLAFLAHMPQLGIAIWLVNLINGGFSFWQEYKAERAVEALQRLLPPSARVLRDGQEALIPAAELVPGDLLVLTEGDHLSADARLVQIVGLQVDQSALTGESRPVSKTSAAVLLPQGTLADISNLVFAGTNVITGHGLAVVMTTGMHTLFGQIAHLTQSVPKGRSPLQQELNYTTRLVTLMAICAGLLFFALAIMLVGMRPISAFLLTLGMIAAFIPEGLLPTVTLTLAMGVQRMAKRHALIKRLSAVETLGCTSVICTDKTGTLTQNAMTVTALWVSGQPLIVTGSGYEPEGEILTAEHTAPIVPTSLTDDLQQFLCAGGLCTNAHLIPPNSAWPEWHASGDPMEAALWVVACKGGLDPETAFRHLPRIGELPFDAHRKRMSTLHRDQDAIIAFVKGAPDELLRQCTHIQLEGKALPLTGEHRTAVMQMNDRYARDGLRVLGVASRFLPATLTCYTPTTVEQKLTFLGLVAMLDPPRPGVQEAVARCHSAGIRMIMVTGDYGLTAEGIGRQIGMVRGERVRILTGTELDRLSAAELQAVVQGEVIFARVAPEHKQRIVAALQAAKEVVAVTGDGVNDAPALKQADIGVAMGIAGTDVAKEAADMILTDDHFASIVNAVEEGRAVYHNIRKFVSYLFTCDLAEAIPFALFAFSGGRIPLALTVMQVLSLDLGAELVPALALGADPPEAGIMDQPPRSLSSHLITPALLLRAFGFLGLLEGLAAMSAFYFHYWTHGFWGYWVDLPASGSLYRAATAMALAGIVAAQVGNLFAQHLERESLRHLQKRRNPFLWKGVLTAFVVVCLVIYVPPFQRLFGTAAFPPGNWLFLLAWSPVLFIADRLRRGIMAWSRQKR